MKPTVLSETPVTMAELKKELVKAKERDEKLSTRANRTEDHLAHAAQLETAKAKELRSRIEKLKVPRLKDQQICKIVDVLPGNKEELKTLLQGYIITVSAENLKKIVDTVNNFVSE